MPNTFTISDIIRQVSGIMEIFITVTAAVPRKESPENAEDRFIYLI